MRKSIADPKRYIHKINNRLFSKKIAQFFEREKIISLSQLFKSTDCKRLSDKEKRNLDIIQFSFVITNKNNDVLLIERKDTHLITKGFSILQSLSPFYVPNRKIYPHNFEDILQYYYDEVKCGIKTLIN